MPGQIISDYLTEALRSSGAGSASEVLIAESNHRIANNLSLVAGILRLQANDIAKCGAAFGAQDAVLLLAEVGARIDTVGRLHRLLAESAGASHMELSGYLHD